MFLVYRPPAVIGYLSGNRVDPRPTFTYMTDVQTGLSCDAVLAMGMAAFGVPSWLLRPDCWSVGWQNLEIEG